jgi:autotransporter translocation and assembly factor TamB
MVRKLVLLGGALGVVLVALVYGLLAGLVLTGARDAAVQSALRSLSHTLQGRLQVGGVQGSLLSAPVVHDIVLKDAQGTVIGQIDALRLSYNLLSLLRWRLTVRELEVVRPRFTLTEEADGTLNIGRALSPAQPREREAAKKPASGFGLPIAVAVEDLRLRDGELALDLPALPGVRQVQGLQVRLQAQLDQQGLQARVQQVTAQTTPAQVDLHTLQGAFQQSGGVLRVNGLRLEMGHTVLTADGVLPNAQQPADFALQLAPLDVAEIGRLLQREALHGQLHLAVKLEGPPEALVADVQLHPVGAAEQGTVMVRGEANIRATPPRYRAQVDVGHLDFTAFLDKPAWQSDVNLQARLEGAGIALRELQSDVRVEIHPSHVGNVALQPSQIDLQAQRGRFQVRRFDVETSMARLQATGALDLAGRSDLQYTLTAELGQLRQLLEAEHLSGDVQLQGQASGEWPDLVVQGALDVRAVRYQDYALDSLRLTYDGAELGAQPRATTQLRLQGARLRSVPVAQVELHAAYDGAARQVRFGIDVDQAPGNGMRTQGTLTLLEAGQRVDIAALQLRLAERLWQTAAPLQVVHEAERLQFTPLRLVHGEESLEISGGLAGEQLQDIRVQASQIDLAVVRRLMALPDPVTGRASLQVLLSGTLPAPLLKADLTVQPEGQREPPFQRLQASLAYAQRLLQGDVRIQQVDREALAVDLRVPIDLAFTALAPEQRLVEGPMALKVYLRQPNLGALARWYKGLPQLTGTLQGAVSVQGTAAQLGLDADLRLQKLGVQNTAEQLEGAISLAGKVVAAPSVQDLQRAIRRGDLTVLVDALALRLAALQGRVPAREAPAQPFEIRDLVLQARGQWSPHGIQGVLQTLTLQARGFRWPRTDLLLEADMTPERIELQRLRVRLPQSEIRGRGRLTMAAQEMQFRLEMPRLQLDDLPFSLPPTLPRQLQGTITARGSLKAPQVEARFTYAGAHIGADLAAQLQDPIPRYQATLRVEGLDVAKLRPELAGEIHTTLQLQGAGFAAGVRRAALNLAVDSRNLSVAPGLTVRLQATMAGEALNLEGLRVSSTPLQLTASGALSSAQTAGITYALTLGDLTPLQPVLGAALQASGTLTGRVWGPLDALQATGALRLKTWRYAELNGGATEADFSAAQLPAAPQGAVKVQLVDVQAPSLPATSLRLEVNYAPPQGTVTATVTKGPYQRTGLTGKLVLNDGQRVTLERLRLQHQDLAWENDGPIEVVRTPQGDLNIQRFNLRSGAQRLSVGGRMAQTGALGVEVRVQQLQIGPSARAVIPHTAIPDGQLSLTLTLTGTLQQPQGRGTLQLTSLAWQGQSLGEMAATLELANQTARTDLRWRAQGRELLQVQGNVGLAADGTLAMRIRSPGLPLEMLKGMVPGVTYGAGLLTLDLQAGGALRQPRLNGSLTLDKGALQLAATGERYRDIQMRIALAGDRIDIQQLRVGSQTGVLEVLGWARLAGLTLQQADVTIRARDFTAMHTSFIEAVTSMDLSVRGSLQSMMAAGTVTVPRLRVQVNKMPGTGPKDVEPWELTVKGVYGPGPQAVAAGEGNGAKPLQVEVPLPFLRANIHVDLSHNAWLQAPGTAIEMRGKLDIRKELQQPFVLSGGIALERGFASAYGKRFVVQQGQVTFTGSPDINPQLDITVTHTVSNYQVQIHVEGKARQPQLSFSSTPELNQTDILSLLIVGKTIDRLTSSEQQSLSSQLGGAAIGAVASRLQEAIGGALGLETFTIGAGESFGGGSVSIGKYVTQDIFLSYEVGVGKGGGNRVGVEYSITPTLKLKGSTSDTGNSAVDFLWRREY